MLPLLKKGSKGTAVEMLQEALNAHGASPALTLDGDFWTLTDTATRNFQAAKGLTVDGVVYLQTWGALGVTDNAVPVNEGSPRPSNARNVPTPPAGSTVFGADISRYQPSVDYAKFATWAKFCWAKATEALTYNDAPFQKELKGCRDHGILFGAYHFNRPDFTAKDQVDHFFKVYTPQKGDLVPMFDNEIHGASGNVHDINQACEAMDRIAQVIGRMPIHYTYVSFLNAQGNPQAYFKYPLDIAHYGPAMSKGPSLPPPHNTWAFWQYIASGSVPGITGDVDHQVFNGTYEELVKNWTL